jgi:hypothetical protein
MKRLFWNGRFWSGAALGLVLSAAACTEGPTSVDDGSSSAARSGLTAEVSSGSGQSGAPGTTLAQQPAVRVQTMFGKPAAGVLVRFTVTQGGGSIERAEALTNEFGIATAGSWRLGTTAGANEVQAQVTTLPVVRFTATAVAAPVIPPPVVGNYSISVRYVGTATTRQRQAVSAAVARWQSVIVSDLPNVSMNVAAGSCFPEQPAMNEVVDDLVLYVAFNEIDGAGKVLGSAGPCYIRTETGLPIIGYLQLDGADLQLMETSGSIDDVVLHEIGHVLGIGTLWSRGSLLTGAGTDDPFFSGTNAVSAYKTLGGTHVGVPVENTGETGTRDGHWRETVFGNELMTGYIAGSNNPLSSMTIASLRDLGYGASTSTAATYTLGGTRSGIVEGGIDLRGREKHIKPKYRVDRMGRKERIDDN